MFCHTPVMTTKTIPEYLEDERQKNSATQLRTEDEAARNLALHHDHHRTAKQPNLELLPPVETITKKRKTAPAARKKPRVVQKRVVQKTATKKRKAA
jgi:hypothetical protein